MPAVVAGVCKIVFLALISNMSSPKEMRSVTFDSSGTLSIVSVPVPVLTDGNIMIEVS